MCTLHSFENVINANCRMPLETTGKQLDAPGRKGGNEEQTDGQSQLWGQPSPASPCASLTQIEVKHSALTNQLTNVETSFIKSNGQPYKTKAVKANKQPWKNKASTRFLTNDSNSWRCQQRVVLFFKACSEDQKERETETSFISVDYPKLCKHSIR